MRGNHRHGHNRVGERSRAYNTWSSMASRCTDPGNKDFADYGGRGITVCERWRSFQAFLADVGEPPIGMTLERINNARGYEPGNTQWATRTAQARNRRNNKLDLRRAREIKLRRENGEAVESIAKDFGVTGAMVSAIARGRTWKYA